MLTLLINYLVEKGVMNDKDTTVEQEERQTKVSKNILIFLEELIAIATKE